MALVAFPVLGLVFWAFGDRLARALGLRSESPAERFALSIVLSYGTVTLVLFGLAAVRGVTFGSVLAVAGAMALLSARDLREKAAGAVAFFRETRWRDLLPGRAGLEGWLALLTFLFYSLGLIVAMAPPTGIDAGVYHFTIPKVILQDRGLVPRDDIWIHKFGGFYMLYVLGMGLTGEVLAKLLAFGASAVAGILAFAGAQRLRPGAGWFGAFILASTPLSAGFTGYENLELPIVMYLLAAFLALLRYEGPGTSRWALLACALAGFAVGTKPNAFPAGVLLPAAAVLMFVREGRRAWPAAAAGMGLFLATSCFWGVWNYFTTGAFVYRYPGTALDQAPMAGSSPGMILGGILRSLRFLTTTGAYWTESAGPFIIAGVAGSALFLWKTERRLPLVLFGLSVAAYLGVLGALSPGHLWTEFGGRYLAPAAAGFGTLAAAPFAAWARGRGGLFRAAVLAALLIPAGPLLILKAGKAAVAAPAAVGLQSRSAYLASKIETFAACEALNRLPEPDVKVLFLAHRPYYLDRPFVHAVYGGPFFRGLGGRDDFVRRARELGITHVLYEPSPPQAPWLSDPETFFGAPPFIEVGRWPSWGARWVRLHRIAAR